MTQSVIVFRPSPTCLFSSLSQPSCPEAIVTVKRSRTLPNWFNPRDLRFNLLLLLENITNFRCSLIKRIISFHSKIIPFGDHKRVQVSDRSASLSGWKTKPISGLFLRFLVGAKKLKMLPPEVDSRFLCEVDALEHRRALQNGWK